MSDLVTKIFLPLSFVLLCLFGLYDIVSHPGSRNGALFLAAAIFFEILVVALWDYRKRFFPLLVLVFLFAGLNLPWELGASIARWFVLATGALVGLIIYLRQRDHSFGPFHLVALFCVLTAVVSSLVSPLPRMALMKSLSLLLMFLYAVAGARIAVRGREAHFFSGLLWACEIVVYVSAVSYFIAQYPLFGNPNSLGVVVGVVALPLLLWGKLISGPSAGRRRSFALVLTIGLLLVSHARASILGAVVSSFVLCIALRRYRLLLKGLGIALLGAVAVAGLMPTKAGESFVSSFVYKGHEDVGLMGSRRTPWEKASAVIEQRPWFGAGFGTSVTTAESAAVGVFSTTAATSREHGNSYLAILEWEGLLGVVPFGILVFMVAMNTGRTMMWVRQTGSPFSPAVPIAAILLAGLIHATFEDWLFAVGYYMCIFFWALAFVLVDVMPGTEPQAVVSVPRYPSQNWSDGYGIVRPTP